VSKYTNELYNEDKAALDAARNVLSALVVGEKSGEAAEYGPYFARIASYFASYDPIGKVMHNGEAVRRVARTFLVISEARQIDGMTLREINHTLDEVEKKIKGMRTFFRRQPKKCFNPNGHRQPCFCARLANSKAQIDAKEFAPDPKKAPKALITGLDVSERLLRDTLLQS
jgi:hypothetical protein